MRLRLGASGAERDCAPSAPSGASARPLNFTVRFLRNRFPKPVARRGFCSYNNLCASPGTRPSALRPWLNGA